MRTISHSVIFFSVADMDNFFKINKSNENDVIGSCFERLNLALRGLL